MNIRKTASLLLVATALFFSACQKEKTCEGTISKTYDNQGFSRISAASVMKVNIQKSNNFSISAEGCTRDINELVVRQSNNGVLEFDFNRNRSRRDPVTINITLPELIAGGFSGASEATISGFQGGTRNMRFALSGASKATVDGTTAQTQVDLSGASVLTLTGTTNILSGTISGASELLAFTTTAGEVDISTSGGAQAFVMAQNILRAQATGGSKVVYRGNPSLKEITTSGGSQVVAD